jgi:hypothetical protein
MEENKRLMYRTYEIVLRQLNGINKGVQAEHSAKRYIWKYRNEVETAIVMEYEDNETTIMVDGGTHQEMCEIQRQLDDAGIKHTYFIEPDLNHCMTAITVLADERVWDKQYNSEFFGGEDEEDWYEKWVESIGGKKNLILREILSGKRLSM